jgi:hypothetical protein
MASTYSSLKIQLMATGENSGTWGTITNTNLGTALEEAITGSADVAFSNANVTLTLTDTNASQTARNLRLNLTGTTGEARELIVPAIEKVYIVNNGCAHTVTVKNTTGAGIAVPAGKTMYLYNNGTDVVDAITHLTSLTLATPLAIADGGTGSTTATFSGANISSINASNISTGTLDNARTTASSANGANTIVARDASGNFSANVITANGSSITAIDASNISSGTLSNDRLGTVSVAKGGTGATTLTGVVIGNGTSAFTNKTNPSGAFVGTTDTQTLTNKTIERALLNDGYTEEVFAITDGATVNLDPNNGSIQTWTLGANRTPGQANWNAGQSITLMVDDGSASAITWSALSVVWATEGGNPPTLNTSGFTSIVLWKVGTTIYGARVGDA